MALYVQGLQDVIDTAVNVEFNRSKLVAQTISRSGRISTASRNWANPYRFTVTPKPVWRYDEARAMIETIYRNDRYNTTAIYFGDYSNGQGTATNPVFAGYISGQVLTVTSLTTGTMRAGDIISGTGVTAGTRIETRISGWGANSIWLVDTSQTVGSSGSPVSMTGDTTTQGIPGQNWISKYRGSQDDNGNYVIDNYGSFSASGTRLIIQEQTGETGPANDFIIRSNDFIRISDDRYPYQASYSIAVPVRVTGVTGAIAVGTSSTTITGLSTVTNLSTGQVLTETGTNVGSFGGTTYIQSIDSASSITIVSDSECTAGAITFTADGYAVGNANYKVAIPINRGYLGAGQPANTGLFVGGAAARFFVKVTKLPTYKFINKDLIEFTGDFELVEEIL
ncbi:hypothetical protein UFOVP281_31 [uncultured Caudovirales phage]|uniref:Uncharacterized protein n=1 Tax=uncultured Caudovirales phage TaxID=2100421 RepID=A0A6J5LKE2_9CAUD|nr:hypothetical protein UFOVP281_31 [uncultured Caudovirales phage]